LKLAFVDDPTFDSELRYMRGLIFALRKIGFKEEITIYARKDRKSETIPGASIRRVWNQFRYPFQITKRAVKDRQEVIHVEFDSATFGVRYTPIFLPLLFLFLRIARKYASVTIHAVPPLNNEKDVRAMNDLLKMRSLKLPPILIKFGAILGYSLIGLLSRRVVVHSQTLKYWLHSGYKVNRDKICVIPHGASTPSSEDIKNATSPPLLQFEKRKIVLFFGRMNKRKGIESLLDAWSRVSPKYPDHVLVIAGRVYRYDVAGKYFSYLKEISRRLQIENGVVFIGGVNEREIDWLFLNSEFVVLPYRFSNAASGPLAIAIGFGKPVIAYAIGTFNDEIINNVNGILVRPDSREDLGLAIESILKDKDLRFRLEKNAQEMINGHSWDFHSKSLLEIWTTRDSKQESYKQNVPIEKLLKQGSTPVQKRDNQI
jgi:glycosyltransferase involved in cell wall biosynthesis